MRGNWIEATHNGTGGTGTITLADVTGSPNFDDVFGASGTILVDYIINEYTDSNRNVLAQSESGIGSLDLPTLVLTRTKKVSTWNGTTYDNTSPSAISFGNTAANVRIICGPASERLVPTIPFLMNNAANPTTADFGYPGAQRTTLSAAPSSWSSAGLEIYWAVNWDACGTVDQIGISLTAVAAAAAQLKFAIYEFGSDGKPGKRLHSFQNSGVDTLDIRNGGATGKVVRTVTPFFLPPGWYWFAGVNEAVFNCHHFSSAGGGYWPGVTTAVVPAPARTITRTGSYATGLTDPATLTGATADNGVCPGVFLRVLNS